MAHLLREFVEMIVERSLRKAQLSNEREAEWGSDDHVADLEDRLRSAQYWRDKYPRGSEKRGHYRNVCSHLKRELQSAKKKQSLNERDNEKEVKNINLIKEGGAVGHLMHLYDNRDLTFVEMKAILRAAAKGKLEHASEKMDGQQLTFTFDVSAGTLLAARAAGDIKRGGLDAASLAAKFEGRGSIADAFNTAFRVLDGAISALSDKMKTRIFGSTANRWYSMEIIYTKSPNVINYDSNAIVFHGWPVFFREKNGDVVMTEDDHGGVDLLTSNIERMQQAVSVRGWKVKGPAIVNLKRISDGTVLSKVISTIDETISAVGIKPTSTMGDYLRIVIRQDVEALGLDQSVTNMIVSRVLEDEGAPTLVDIKKKLDKSDHATVTQFVKNSSVLLKDAVRPIELSINNFAAEVLRGLQSTLVDDTSAEVERIKDEVRSAISALESSGDESTMSVLKRQLEKLKDVENITTPMEGVVFIWKGNAYKFTGSFAAANAILGILKYSKKSKTK